MKKFVYDGKNYDKLPDPLVTGNGSVSPVTEALFVSMGGTITDDGVLNPAARVRTAFADLIVDLAKQTDAMTPAEFLTAAQDGISSDLITLARARGVPDSVIEEARTRIVEIMADALRFGVTWTELIAGGNGA